MTSQAKDLIRDDKLIQLLHLAEDQGWDVKPTASASKIMWYPPDKTKHPVTSPTRLVGRTLKNVTTALERAGLDTSSLKRDKSKEGPDIPQEAAMDEIERQGIEAIHQMLGDNVDFTDEQMDLIAKSTQLFSLDVLGSLFKFTRLYAEITGLSGPSDERIDEAERLYLETSQELEHLRVQHDKQAAKMNDLVQQISSVSKQHAEAVERANKAESRLKALRSALVED